MKLMRAILGGLGVAVVAALCVLSYWQANQTDKVSQEARDVREQLAEVQQYYPQIKLPEDGQAYHLSVVMRPNWRERARDRELVSWFQSEPRLAALATQTHMHVYEPDDPIYKANLAHRVGGLPAVLLQDSTGAVKYAAWEGAGLPQAAVQLGDQVANMFGGGCRPCPKPNPDPSPNPQPIVPDKPPTPVLPGPVTPAPVLPAPSQDGFPWAALLAIAAIAGLGGAVYQFRERVRA